MFFFRACRALLPLQIHIFQLNNVIFFSRLRRATTLTNPHFDPTNIFYTPMLCRPQVNEVTLKCFGRPQVSEVTPKCFSRPPSE